MNILLLNPGIICVGRYGSMPMSPMGLLRIGAHLKEQGHNVKLIDAAVVPNFYLAKCSIKDVYQDYPFVDYRPCGSIEQHEREGMVKPVHYYGRPISWIKQQMIKAFDGKQPDQVWVGSHLTYYYETSWELVSVAKEMFPRAKVLLGGIYPTLVPEHAARSGADICYKGEIPDLEGVMPDYSLLDYDSSIKMFKSSRGCKVNPPCAFCAVPFMEKKFSPMDVDATFNWIKEEFDKGTRDFIMWSSQLLMPPRTFKQFCEKVIESGMPGQGLKLAASEGIQPSLFKDDIAEIMRKAGFDDVNIPLEAIRDDRVDEYHKPSDLNDVERSIDLAFKHGFRSIKAFIMTATPGQSAEEIVEAVVYCWSRNVRTSMMAFTPVPGSEMFAESEEFQSRPLELLNPFLWPAAHEELTCQELEEIISIAAKRFDLWSLTGRRKSRIDTMFEHYCRKYNLFKERELFLTSAIA